MDGVPISWRISDLLTRRYRHPNYTWRTESDAWRPIYMHLEWYVTTSAISLSVNMLTTEQSRHFKDYACKKTSLFICPVILKPIV
jgi:hypothetical protein